MPEFYKGFTVDQVANRYFLRFADGMIAADEVSAIIQCDDGRILVWPKRSSSGLEVAAIAFWPTKPEDA